MNPGQNSSTLHLKTIINISFCISISLNQTLLLVKKKKSVLLRFLISCHVQNSRHIQAPWVPCSCRAISHLCTPVCGFLPLNELILPFLGTPWMLQDRVPRNEWILRGTSLLFAFLVSYARFFSLAHFRPHRCKHLSSNASVATVTYISLSPPPAPWEMHWMVQLIGHTVEEEVCIKQNVHKESVAESTIKTFTSCLVLSSRSGHQRCKPRCKPGSRHCFSRCLLVLPRRSHLRFSLLFGF